MVMVRGVRESFGAPEDLTAGAGRGIVTAAKKDERVVIVMNDVGHYALDWFRSNAPQRVFELGIAEANGAVVAAGLASEGYIPYWNPIGFAGVGRAYNQIRQCICVDRFNVKMLFSTYGYTGPMGVSHNFIEATAALRVLPNMVIVNPADAAEAEKAAAAIVDYVGPVSYLLERPEFEPPPRMFDEDYLFELGRSVTIREGEDATIVASGLMVSRAFTAAGLLQKEGLEARVVNMSTLKPLDKEAIVKAGEETGAVVTAENHMITGGLGEGVAAVLGENVPVPMLRVGVRDEFSQSAWVRGNYDPLGELFSMRAKDIANAVRCVVKKKRR